MNRLYAAVLLSLLSAPAFAANCVVDIKGNDAMQFDKKEVTVDASCKSITLKFTHTGKLPVAVMGHNVVVVATPDLAAMAKDGMAAGAAAHYVPKNAKILGSTKVVGGGQSTQGTMSAKLKAGGDYTFFCSFPGHSSIMKGKLIVK